MASSGDDKKGSGPAEVRSGAMRTVDVQTDGDDIERATVYIRRVPSVARGTAVGEEPPLFTIERPVDVHAAHRLTPDRRTEDRRAEAPPERIPEPPTVPRGGSTSFGLTPNEVRRTPTPASPPASAPASAQRSASPSAPVPARSPAPPTPVVQSSRRAPSLTGGARRERERRQAAATRIENWSTERGAHVVEQSLTLEQLHHRPKAGRRADQPARAEKTHHFHSPCRPSFLAVLFAAASTMIIANSPPMDKLIMTLQRDNPTARASTFDTGRGPSLFEPLFGPQANQICMNQCQSSPDREVCFRACGKLSLTEYARQIRLVNHTPETDATRITDACMNGELPPLQFTGIADWERVSTDAMKILRETGMKPPSGDFARSRLIYEQLLDVMQSLRFPPSSSAADSSTPNGARALTEQILRISCLRAHHALSEIAVVLTDQNKDSYSTRYYAELARRLNRSATELEQRVIKDAPQNSQGRTAGDRAR